MEKSQEVASFIKALKDASYDGRISIEGKSDDWQRDSLKSLLVLRELDGGM